MQPRSPRSPRSPATGQRLPVAVVANIGSAREAEAAAAAGADGIGLVRTELLFLGRSMPPSVAEQRAVYRRIRGAARPARRLPHARRRRRQARRLAAREPEANPALGVRGHPLGLRRSALLDDQLRALLEAAAGERAWIMLPMVATVEEVAAARERLEAVRPTRRRGRRPVATGSASGS